MQATHLALQDFRSYKYLDLSLGRGLTVVVADNGQGKTNLLEALALASRMRSPRTDQVKETIRWGEALCAVHITFRTADQERRIGVTVGARGLSVKIDGEAPVRRAQAIGLLAVVLFTPDDLRLIKDEPERRRAFVDEVVLLVGLREGAAAALHYSQVLRQRNALLKQIRDGETRAHQLEAWDEQLIHWGVTLTLARREACTSLAQRAAKRYKEIAEGEQLAVIYRSHITDEPLEEDRLAKRFRERLTERRELEVLRGQTVVGPHRDDVHITIGERPAREYASQGEQRSAALALKLAELDLVAAARGEQPVLLLDDVMSELDGRRRHALARTLSGLEQTIVTTTTRAYLEDAAARGVQVRWLRVEGGRVWEEHTRGRAGPANA